MRPHIEGGVIDGQVIDGRAVKNMAASDKVGGIPVLYMFTLAAGANADNDIVVEHKIRVVNAWLVLQGAGVTSSVLTIKSGANAISDGMAASGADKAVVRCATLDDANWEIAAGGTLRATSSGGASQPAMTVLVEAIRIA